MESTSFGNLEALFRLPKLTDVFRSLSNLGSEILLGNPNVTLLVLFLLGKVVFPSSEGSFGFRHELIITKSFASKRFFFLVMVFIP